MKIKNIHIIIFFAVIIILYIGMYAFNRYQEINAYKLDNFDLSINDYNVKWIYKHYPELFKFSEDGECIITISELLKGQSENVFDLMHDKYGNDCVGYYIINKDIDKNITIDSSHICDMIDY